MASHLTKTRETIPVIRHSFQGCADEYASIMAPIFGVSPIKAEHGFAQNTAQAWETNLGIFGYGKSNPFAGSHSINQAQDSGHLVEVTRFLSGTEQGVSRDCIIDRRPGQIYVLDQARPIETLTSHFEVQQAFVPKAIIDVPDDWFLKERIIDEATHNGALLHDCMSDLYCRLSRNEGALETGLLGRFFSLLKINLGVHPEREDVRVHFRRAQKEQICKFIETHLSDPKLSTNRLLANFGVSRATLFRMFEPDGGVRTYITQRRAIRAILDISKKGAFGATINQASEHWGFSSRPNFNRTVRRLFGSSPSKFYPNPDVSALSTRPQWRILERFAKETALTT